ncbi:MAG: ABC transporter permease [Phycisphaerales bacterium]|nr:ABC transporter permease [Phycisphaerales bacterium]
MWSFILRRLLYNIPVYLGILLLVMGLLRVRNPVYAYLGKNADEKQIAQLEESFGLNDPFIVQYGRFLWKGLRLDFGESWKYQGTTVREKLLASIPPSLSITVPALILTSVISITVGLMSSFYRGRWIDRLLVIAAVLGMSISFLVYIIFGQFFGAFLPKQMGLEWWPLEIGGSFDLWFSMSSFSVFGLRVPYPDINAMTWVKFCLLPVLISVIVSMGYDTRFYRAVMVEECNRDYIITARAKGATKRKIMFVHMLKNAMIPIITRIMTTLPFLITGSILLEMYFNIPGMGRTLITAITDMDYPMIQGFTAVIALLYILSIILTDVLYALVDPRVRLS